MMKKKLLKIAAIFVVLMMIFTVLSRAADDLTIAQVKTQKPSSMSIDHSVESSGQITQTQDVAIITSADLTVETVDVNVGKAVSAGDVLFTLDLEQINNKIEKLEKSIDLSNRQVELANAKEEKDRKVSASQVAINKSRAQEDYDEAVSKGDKSVSLAEKDYTSAANKYNQYIIDHPETRPQTTAAPSTEDELDEIAEETTTTQADTKKYYDESEAESLKKNVEDAQNIYSSAVADKESSVKTAKRSLEDAQFAEESLNSIEQTTTSVDVSTDQETLEKLRELQNNNGEITAPIDSVVTKISVSVGDKTIDGTSMLLADMSTEAKLTVSISTNDKKYVSVGDSVTVTGTNMNGEKQTIEDLTIATISTSENTGNSTDTFSAIIYLPNNTLQLGSTATAKINNVSEKYSVCVPIAALHQDEKNQYFVLSTEESSSILGEQLIASKIQVTVLDKNGKYAALSEGSITPEQRIIVESSKDIEEGSRIRLQES